MGVKSTAAAVVLAISAMSCMQLPASQTLDDDVTFLDQNWTQEQRQAFYFEGQGTVMMPVEWFVALEQPEIRFVGTPGLFRDDAYLTRFGFIPGRQDPMHNPNGLPIGFSQDEVTIPDTGEKMLAVGLTCAACHVSQLTYKGESIRIDGGTSMIAVTEFQNALGFALFLTDKLPFRFARFAERVLGEDSTDEERLALKEQVNELLEAGLAEQDANRKGKIYEGHPGGYGRTDALARIGNFVFATELDNLNLFKGNAPVKFPHIWDVSWFSWAQYNGSVGQPMVRNIGEALGVRAQVNLDPRPAERFLDTTVDVEGLVRLEGALSGEEHFQGLKSPVWPGDIFGQINRESAARGERLYQQRCQGCHHPPLTSPEIWDPANIDRYWTANDDPEMLAGFAPPLERDVYFNNSMIDLGEIGTDPGQAVNMVARVIFTPGVVLPLPTLGLWDAEKQDWAGPEWYGPKPEGRVYPETSMGLGSGLQRVAVPIAQQWYDAQGLSLRDRQRLSGKRNPAVQALLKYRTRPLNGIWAAPPYLHNGSVPTLYQLLSPHEERDAVFYTGGIEYDPVHVGLVTKNFPGAFEYDTSVKGNSNRGHEFARKPLGDGVIGPYLEHQERMDLIEYLKSLEPPGPPPAEFLAAARRGG